jgi:hypothetical protein
VPDRVEEDGVYMYSLRQRPFLSQCQILSTKQRREAGIIIPVVIWAVLVRDEQDGDLATRDWEYSGCSITIVLRGMLLQALGYRFTAYD